MIDWHFPRSQLAQQYMNAFDTGITGALAIFAPRRMGKTEFVLMDLAPEAEARGYRVGYCSFWNLQDNPAKSLRLALDAVSEKVDWPKKWLSTLGASTAEISAGLAGTGIKVKTPDEKVKAEENDLLAIIGSLGKLAKQKKPLLLLLDEIQHLAHDTHAPLVATMRTQFEEHRTKIRVVYTEHHLLRHMVIQGIWAIEKGYEHFLTLIDVDADFAVLWGNCKPVDRAVLTLLAKKPDLAIYSDEARGLLGEEIGADGISVEVVQNSIERLRLNQILYSPTRGEWVFEDQSFQSWIISKSEE